MAGTSCLTEEMKEIISKSVKSEPDFAMALITTLPLCSGETAVKEAVKVASSREMPAQWNASVTYYDADSKKQEFGSISALTAALKLKMSGSQAIMCDAGGKTCKAASVPEILQLQGYTVWGNGSASPIVKGVTKHFTVFHPQSSVCKIPGAASAEPVADIKRDNKPGEVKEYKLNPEELAYYLTLKGPESEAYMNKMRARGA